VRAGQPTLLFAHAHTLTASGLQPTISAVEDRLGVLHVRWRSVLEVQPGDDVHAAPALHADSGTLLVTTLQNVYLFRDIASVTGQMRCPPAACPDELVPCAADPRTSSV